MIRLGFFLMFLGVIFQCTTTDNPPTKLLKLEEGSVSMEIPMNSTTKIKNATPVVVFWENTEHSRTPKYFSIKRIDKQTKVSYSDSLTMGNQSVLYYDFENYSGGSGGEESSLEGIVSIKNALFEIKSFEQSEGRKPNAKWCFPYLQTLDLVE